MTDPLQFAFAALILLLVPGPTNTLLLSSGMMAGFRRSCCLIPYEMLGYAVSIAVQSLILGGLVFRFPGIETALRVLGVLYLFWLTVGMWRQGAASDLGPVAQVGMRRVFVTTLFNPKALLFTVGIIPYLAQGQVLAARPYLVFLLMLIACAGLGWIAVGTLVGKGAERLLSPRLVMRGGAVAMGCFALVWLHKLL